MHQSDDVLVPLVNEPHQQAAIGYAVDAAADGTVTVLNVVTPIDEPLSEGRVLRVTEGRWEAARDRARHLVDDATGQGDSAVEITVAAGRPAQTVADHASERDVDRIVMGERDRSVLPSALFGRTVPAVIDDLTDVPMTVVDAPG